VFNYKTLNDLIILQLLSKPFLQQILVLYLTQYLSLLLFVDFGLYELFCQLPWMIQIQSVIQYLLSKKCRLLVKPTTWNHTCWLHILQNPKKIKKGKPPKKNLPLLDKWYLKYIRALIFWGRYQQVEVTAIHHRAPKQASSICNVKLLKVCGKGKIRPSFRDQSGCVFYEPSCPCYLKLGSLIVVQCLFSSQF